MVLNKILILIFLPSFAYAQSLLLSESTEVVMHKSKNTNVNYILKEKLAKQDALPDGIKGMAVAVPGYIYSGDVPSGAGVYDGLPKCSKSQVRQVLRAESEDSFLSVDVYVYQFDDQEQKNKGQVFGFKAVPYIEGALSNPYRPDGDTAQTIIRALGVQCLPTRIRSISRNQQKAFEYREGDLAWKQEE